MSSLELLTPVCHAIAALFPGQVEVVLHDLKSQRIAVLVNAMSPRKPGDDSLTDIGDFQANLSADDTIGPYLKSNSDGAKLRSVSALIRDDTGAPAALLCMNLRVDALEAAKNLLAQLTSTAQDINDSAFIKNDWREVTNAIIAATLNELKISFNQLRRNERQVIVSRLLAADVFAARGSADFVAEALGISRASLYSLIKQCRASAAPAERA
ncbi:PAS domain-containing protein [Pseudovibrio exalbescens]|uniref:helix-turn-helix transcriptional regulator n=1 Tax=Pseudovibrio exalbescens TaxID=197461 RepID=UPI00236623AE|nr:PAS domain-containing protein [Pseudovibrio exalbescens]MDD7909579.1 PAS domain-containing protein [Pseudovibrio exalbescens]